MSSYRFAQEKDPSSRHAKPQPPRAHEAHTKPLGQRTGTVKFFDLKKGFGFIQFSNGAPDALVHVTKVKEAHQEGCSPAALTEGMTVTCEAIDTNRGWQVARILSVDESTALPFLPRILPEHDVAAVGGFELCIVMWFNRIRGFGFVSRGGGTEEGIFVHMEVLRACSISEIKPGESWLVRYGDGPKGLTAVEVRPFTPGVLNKAAE